MSARTHDDGPIEPNVTKRRFMQITGATAAAVATGAVGIASAASLDYSSEYVHDPRAELDLTVAEVDRSEMGALEYVADDGSIARLEGGALAEREDDSTAHNPVEYEPTAMSASELVDFPRDVTRENADGEEEPVRIVDAQEWSATSGLTVEETTTEADGDAIRFATDGLADGSTESATFDNFEISSGEPRKHAQVVARVSSLASGSSATIRINDSAGNSVELVVDPSADASQDHVIATSTGSFVAQPQLGELAGDTELDTFTSVDVEIANGDVDLELVGFNLERESRWSLGRREYVNADDEIETETVHEAEGAVSITGLGTLDDVFSSATLAGVTYDAEIAASRLPSSYVDDRWSEAERYALEWRHEVVYNVPIPSAYDVEVENVQLVDVVRHPGDRYQTAEHDVVAEALDVEDVEDADMTEATSQYEGASIGDELSIRSASSGDTIALALEYHVTDDEREAMESAGGGAGGAGAAAAASSGGILNSAWAWVATILAGVGAYVAWARRKATGAR